MIDKWALRAPSRRICGCTGSRRVYCHKRKRTLSCLLASYWSPSGRSRQVLCLAYAIWTPFTCGLWTILLDFWSARSWLLQKFERFQLILVCLQIWGSLCIIHVRKRVRGKNQQNHVTYYRNDPNDRVKALIKRVSDAIVTSRLDNPCTAQYIQQANGNTRAEKYLEPENYSIRGRSGNHSWLRYVKYSYETYNTFQHSRGTELRDLHTIQIMEMVLGFLASASPCAVTNWHLHWHRIWSSQSRFTAASRTLVLAIFKTHILRTNESAVIPFSWCNLWCCCFLDDTRESQFQPPKALIQLEAKVPK
jgi:hypothetical protein